MASAAAQQHFNSQSPEEQARIKASWGGQDRMDEWYQNAVNAGAVQGVAAPGSTQAEEGGNISPFQNAAPSSEWLGKRKPNAQELRKWAAETGRSEDYNRFPDAAVSGWIDRNWDVSKGSFVNNYGDLVDKPDERGANTPAGFNGTGDSFGAGGGGGFGGGGGGGAGGAFSSNVPQFNYTPFVAPNPQDVLNDPSYKFRVQEGEKALQGSAAARGVLRTGGTLKDLMGYGQDMASQEYGNAYNRALQTWGAQYQGQKDAFAPQYGAWQTQYAGDLSKWTTGENSALQKYLNRENNVYGLLNPSMPSY